VVTNFEVDTKPYPKAVHTCVDDDVLTPDFLVQYSQNYFGGRKLSKKDEDTILLVIDECQLLFNSRDYQKKDRKAWIKFFSLHRHFGYHIILIAQMDKMIDKQIRGVIEYEFIHRKLSNYGKAGKVATVLLLGELFTCVQMWYPLKLKVGSFFFRAKKKYYSLYDSYSTFGEPKTLPASEPAPPLPAQEETCAAAPAPEPEVKQGEVVQDKLERKKFRKIFQVKRPEKKKKKIRRSSYIDGSYVRPWDKRTLVSNNGKFLRPGGRSETGWSITQRHNA